ncbi:hypothetical protein HDZ31DRAFT_62711 [Schizophyllum fasciatum]
MSNGLPPFPSAFKGDFVTQNDPDYPKAIKRWTVTTEKRAKVVAFIRDADDASLAIAYARENNLPIAIMGGGHSAAGASSVEDGLIVDCSRYLNYCRVDEAKKIGYVGGGSRWETVDRAAYKHGLATVGGTVNDTGVAGLTLGGGFGYLSGLYGVALDNLLGATVVLANGQHVYASATENSDLFFGIRGGGSNFGVITEFVFQLHDQRPTIFGGVLKFSVDAMPGIVAASAEYWKVQDPRACMLQLWGTSAISNGKPEILCTIFYNGSEAEGRAHFKKFYECSPIENGAKEIPYEEANAMTNHIFLAGGCEYQKGVAHIAHDNLEVLTKLVERAAALSAQPGLHLAFTMGFFPRRRIMDPAAYQDCAFRRDPHPDINFIAMWHENTPENFAAARAIVYDMHGLATRLYAEYGDPKASELAGYANVDDEAAASDRSVREAKGRAAFGEVYPRLQQIKKRYDPELVFDRWYPIIPA